MTFKTMAAAGLTLLLACSPAQGESAAEIMDKADRMNRADYEVSRMEMTLSEPGGSVLKRELIWYFRNEDGKRSSLLKFTAPANMRGVGILVIEQTGVPNAIWHYLPASRNVRRISPEHRQNRFMGTEFIFEDFEGIKPDKYAFTASGTQACAATSQCHVIEALASDKDEMASSSYGKKVFHIDRQSYVIVRTELYDKSGKLAKVFDTSGWRRIGNHARPQVQTMTNIVDKRVTLLREVERKLDVPFEPYYTGQQYLRSE